MTSVARALAILDVFTPEHPVWQTDELIAALSYTRPTGYRYIRELVAAGFLQKVAAGRYALGARIVVLDHQLRQTDPVLQAAAPHLASLAADTGLDVVLSAMFNGQVVDTFRTGAHIDLELAYGRGRIRPLFRGAAPKVLLAWLPRPQLIRVHRQHPQEIAEAGLGNDWPDFRRHLAEIRREGFYLSLGELEPAVGAAAVPLCDSAGDALAALALVGTLAQLEDTGAPALRQALQAAAGRIQADLHAAT